MTESQENELADMITDVAIDYANGHAVDFRIAAKAAVAFVLAASAQASAPWQPIETAPKDGTRFIAWIKGHVEFMHWQDKGNGSDRPIGWRDSFIYVYEQGSGPSYWMPSPTAPVIQIDASKEPQ